LRIPTQPAEDELKGRKAECLPAAA
jgi:hypothetical protein